MAVAECKPNIGVIVGFTPQLTRKQMRGLWVAAPISWGFLGADWKVPRILGVAFWVRLWVFSIIFGEGGWTTKQQGQFAIPVLCRA